VRTFIVQRSYMTDDDGTPAYSIKLCELLLKPVKLCTRVITSLQQVEVKIVTTHSIDSNDPRFIIGTAVLQC
jgi:hypothetical protein